MGPKTAGTVIVFSQQLVVSWRTSREEGGGLPRSQTTATAFRAHRPAQYQHCCSTCAPLRVPTPPRHCLCQCPRVSWATRGLSCAARPVLAPRKSVQLCSGASVGTADTEKQLTPGYTQFDTTCLYLCHICVYVCLYAVLCVVQKEELKAATDVHVLHP